MNTTKILIVEDEFIAAESLSLDLQRAGYQVVGMAASGEQALKKVEQVKPDLVLMDIVIRGKIDGITTSDLIHEKYRIPIVYLTSFSDLKTLNRAKATEPRGYVVKPYVRDDLLVAVSQALIKHHNSLKTTLKQIKRKAKIGVYKVKEKVHQNFGLPSLNSYEHQLKRDKYQQRLPSISSADLSIIQAIYQEGVYISNLEELGLPNTNSFLQEIQAILPEAYTIAPQGEWSVRISWSRKFIHNNILLWGLAERLLDIIENYIGLPLVYHGVDLRRDLANYPHVGPKQWHRDIDDDRMIKLILYLNDVESADGPFEYIPRYLTENITQSLHYTSGFVSDRAVAEIVPPQDWKICTGKSGTLVLTDPCNIFHRAKPATNSDRISLTFGYTSRIPKVALAEFQLSPSEWQQVSTKLSKRQLSCLRRKK